MIIKLCKKHGPLTKDQCYTHNQNEKKCFDCAECVKARQKARYYADPELASQEYKARYEKNRSKFLNRVKVYVKINYDEVKKRRDIRRLKQKIIALSHYSIGCPACEICSNTDISHLCLDHIYGDGTKHRKTVKTTRGSSVYRWVIREKFPRIFRVLCHNCNWIAHITNSEIGKSKSAESTRRCRIDVLKNYSNGTMQCAKCNNNDIRVLSIDHMNGGGTQHRNYLGGSSINVYRWLRKNGYPDGYQVLCLNHNIGKPDENDK